MKPITFFKKEFLIWVLILTPFIYAMIYWSQLPESVPIHWDINGKANGWSPKGIGILLIPFMNLGLYFLFLILPKIDPRKENYYQFKTAYKTVRILMHTILSLVFIMSIYFSMHAKANSSYFSIVIVTAIIMVFGNIMGKIRPNFFVGVRTPWTLANEVVWVKTHRFTGWIWVGFSFIYLIMNLIILWPAWVHYFYFGIITVLPIIYSYYIYKRLGQNSD